MKSSIESLYTFGKKIVTAITRFPITFIAILLLTIFVFDNMKENNFFSEDYRIWFFLPLVIVSSLAVYLFGEKLLKFWVTNIINLILIGIFAGFIYSMNKYLADFQIYQLLILIFSFAIIILAAPYILGKYTLRFWDYAQDTFFQFLIAAFFGAILMGGLSLALLSLEKLFSIKISDYNFGNLATLCFVLFTPLYFIASIPEKQPIEKSFKIEYPKILKILGVYILLPILIIYTIILYGYLAKIIITWQLPDGWVSLLVSILGIFGYLTIFILYPLYLSNPFDNAGNYSEISKKNKVIYIFSRYFPIVLLPLLILMSIGIVRRLSDYGLSINRLLVLIVNIWLIGVSIYLFITKVRHIKWFIISLALLAFLSAVGPWNIFNITQKSINKELTSILTEAGWYSDTTEKISDEEQNRAIELILYLKKNYGAKSLVSFYGKKVKDDASVYEFIKALDFNQKDNIDDYFYTKYNGDIRFDLSLISNYKTLMELNTNGDELYYDNEYKVTLDDEGILVKNLKDREKDFSIPLNNIIISALKNTSKSERDLSKLTLEEDNYKLIIINISGYENPNGTKINYLNAYLLIK